MRRSIAKALLAFFLMLAQAPSHAAEMVMFWQGGCVWCQRWDEQIGTIYGRTDEAKVLPLRRVDIRDQSSSGIALASPVRYTPTFVVVDEGREIGRITGYINDEAFWGLLGTLVSKVSARYGNAGRT